MTHKTTDASAENKEDAEKKPTKLTDQTPETVSSKRKSKSGAEAKPDGQTPEIPSSKRKAKSEAGANPAGDAKKRRQKSPEVEDVEMGEESIVAEAAGSQALVVAARDELKASDVVREALKSMGSFARGIAKQAVLMAYTSDEEEEPMLKEEEEPKEEEEEPSCAEEKCDKEAAVEEKLQASHIVALVTLIALQAKCNTRVRSACQFAFRISK